MSVPAFPKRNALKILGAAWLALVIASCDGAVPAASGKDATTPAAAPPMTQAEPASEQKSWAWRDGDLQGWTIGAVQPVVSWPEAGGISIKAPARPEFPDLFLRSPSLSFAGSEYPTILVDLEAVVPAPQTDLALYYTTPAHGEDFNLRGAPLDSNPLAAGDRRVLVYDMTRLAAGGSDWVDSVIRRIRFDLPQGAGSHYIVHSIRICEAGATDCN